MNLFGGACTIVIAWIWGLNLVAAQTGFVTGSVHKASTQEPLSGVNIVVRGSSFGTTSANDGSYRLTGIPYGARTIVFSAVGFKAVETEVTVGPETHVNAELEQVTVDLSTVVVEGERSFSAASSRTIRQFDMLIRPTRSAQDLLQLVPGLVLAQHAGGGKAEQIFLRGFDADHGTDVALYADGIPVNMVSHGHGQGYADLHFLIPETIELMEVHKGPYFAKFGNLSTAGTVELTTKDHIDRNLIKAEGGAFNSGVVTTLFRVPFEPDHESAYFAAQFYGSDGPFDSPQHFRRFNLFGKFHLHPDPSSTLSISAGAFSSGWDASGQIPTRAVESGMIGRFGSIDDLEGGTTNRENLSVAYTSGSASATQLRLLGYVSRYSFKLFSNFTFFLNDSLNGDMIEQTDERVLSGFTGDYMLAKTLGSMLSTTTIGGGFRSDAVDVALWKSPGRTRETPRAQASINEQNFFLYIDEQLVINPHWRIQAGIRGDYFAFNVNDHLDLQDPQTTDLPHASGFAQETIINPKLNIVFSPFGTTDLFFNAGSGFHSNDSRDVILAARMQDISHQLRRNGQSEQDIEMALLQMNFDPSHQDIKTLPRALGSEVGLRIRPADQLILSLAAWVIQLEEELVYVGDEGSTEISGRTRRLGLDAELRWQALSWLWFDADVSLAHGRFLDEPEAADRIPLAPTFAATGGATVVHPSGIDARLQLRHVDPRPANESGTVTALGYTVANLSLGYRFGIVRVYALFENVLDEDWNEAQFDTESRLRNEPMPVSEIHFAPGVPRNLHIGVMAEF